MRKKSRFILISFFIVVFTFFYGLSRTFQKSKDVFAGPILESGKKLYSQKNEELIIRDFFNDRKGGVFLDVGCFHYMGMSTTYYLEKHLGWSGIAVDALAEFALGYIENRPNTRFFNFIATDHSGDVEPFHRMRKGPAFSTSKKETADEILSRRGELSYQIIYVPTITLTELLKMNGVSKIDFLSMDIEDSEPEALAGFDIKKFKPELVCIEAHLPVRNEIMIYFTRNDYERIEKYLEYDKLNWYFKPKE